jgi:hypothetical protein
MHELTVNTTTRRHDATTAILFPKMLVVSSGRRVVVQAVGPGVGLVTAN